MTNKSNRPNHFGKKSQRLAHKLLTSNNSNSEVTLNYLNQVCATIEPWSNGNFTTNPTDEPINYFKPKETNSCFHLLFSIEENETIHNQTEDDSKEFSLQVIDIDDPTVENTSTTQQQRSIPVSYHVDFNNQFKTFIEQKPQQAILNHYWESNNGLNQEYRNNIDNNIDDRACFLTNDPNVFICKNKPKRIRTKHYPDKRPVQYSSLRGYQFNKAKSLAPKSFDFNHKSLSFGKYAKRSIYKKNIGDHPSEFLSPNQHRKYISNIKNTTPKTHGTNIKKLIRNSLIQKIIKGEPQKEQLQSLKKLIDQHKNIQKQIHRETSQSTHSKILEIRKNRANLLDAINKLNEIYEINVSKAPPPGVCVQTKQGTIICTPATPNQMKENDFEYTFINFQTEPIFNYEDTESETNHNENHLKN